ncbi:MAG: hypothetical protein DI586_02380 [Micavibrio aeruginosavorus]|uniref:Amine oxidase domain-containing protein n=1 Tax=Micavibrio aeruginosavorus TaxID=349221 RepID=A0A2W5FPC0_9BACT|nr:MAG: hypothetical protein DI586_02380 [Micavibrio aeruginosavorus]
MLGRLNTDVKEVTIIGAGYAGLLSAYRLLNLGYAVTIHEKSGRAGGLISTRQTDHGPAEAAAHSIRSSSEILRLFDDLKLDYVAAKTKKKFILRDGKLKGNPLTLWEMFTAGSYAAFKKSDGIYPSLADWAKAHIGEGALDNAITPLAHGIYAAEPEELDQQLAFPRMSIPMGQTLVDKVFKDKTQPKKSPGKSFVMAPAKGMGALINALTQAVQNHPNGRVIFNSAIETLPDVSNLIVTVPAPAAGKLIGSNILSNIKYAPMITATVFVKTEDLNKLEGIGFLNARGEDKRILGVLFNSSTFDHRARENYASLSVMLGGTSNPHILQKADDEIKVVIKEELNRVLNFTGTELETVITRWPNAIPLYSPHLRETLENLEKGWCSQEGRMLFGNYTGEVSIRGMCQTSLALGRE